MKDLENSYYEEEESNDMGYYREFNWGSTPYSPYDVENDFVSSGWIGDFHLDKVLSYGIALGASDIHLTPSKRIAFTVLGDIVYSDEFPVLSGRILSELVNESQFINNQTQGLYASNLNADAAYEIKIGPFKGSRLRVSVGYTFNEDFVTFRVINDDIPSIDDLSVESELLEWMKFPNGLFLISGSTGTGKSTTLASMIRETQLNESKKIITIENPVEYIYPENGKSLIVQREVGNDVLNFYDGLTAAMRQAPDIILLGEVRNSEEVSELIRAAETGHLAISTMHTNSVPTTINRIMSLFDGSEQLRIMSTLADTIRGLANQVLVRDGKGGRFAVREILIVDDYIRPLIANGDVAGLRDYMRENNLTMEYKLAYAVATGKCKYNEAIKHTSFPEEFIKQYNQLSGY